MIFNFKKDNRLKLDLEIKISKEEVLKSEQLAMAKIINSVQIPGFRKGKAPAQKVLELYSHKIKEESIENLLKDGIDEFLRKENLQPSERPTLTDVKWQNDHLILKVNFHVFDNIELKKYKGFNLKEEKAKIDTKELDQVLKKLAKKNSSATPIEEGKLKDNDILNADMTFKSKEIEFNKTFENVTLDLSLSIYGFEKKVIGKKLEDNISFKIDFKDLTVPLEIKEEDKSKIKKIEIELKVKGAHTSTPVDIDDNLAKSEGFANLEELKNQIEMELLKKEEQKLEEKQFNEIINLIKKESSFNIPGNLIDDEIKQRKERIYSQFSQIKGLKDSENNSKIDEALKMEVESELKELFIMRTIIGKENIRVTNEELEKALLPFKGDKKRMEQAKTFLPNSLLIAKVRKFLFDNNIVN